MFRARIRAYRVPQREYANDLGPVFPPVGIIVSVIPKITAITYPRTFLVQAYQQLWLVLCNDVY